MKKAIIKNGFNFTIEDTKKGVLLSYTGQSNDPYMQGCFWICDSETEAKDMIEAVIDPSRYADDEYKVRHASEWASRCRW